MRRPIIAGNWKMYKGPAETAAFVAELWPQVRENKEVEIVVCPPFVSLEAAVRAGRDTAIAVGAQDVYWEKQGAFTGEVSAGMLAEVGCRYGLVGHSERRQLFGETDAGVNRKARALLEVNITPIICVGETLEQREQGATARVCQGQLEAALQGLSPEQVGGLVVAYEPVWAIGTGRNATSADAQAVIGDLRRLVVSLCGPEAGKNTRFQYGGSVKPGNIADFMAQPDIDGVLVGGASLVVADFAAIINYRVAAG
ncbi:MAG: triose-phosphate isomerase [Clostridia bacterium]|nr:MAG: triose-phosphate isomerase [Clostridia bacterium]